jgi:DNA-directed RNA polymerase specialized sigma subunit
MSKRKNPVEDFMDVKEASNEKSRQNTQEMWHRWNDNGRTMTHMDPMIDNFSGLVASKMRDWKAPNIEPAAFEAVLRKQVINAVEGYDPNRGAALNTHVTNTVKKSLRFLYDQQNIARMSEGKTTFIGKINRAHDELHEDLGRPPTHEEIGQHIGKPASWVSSVYAQQRNDVPASMFDSDPTSYQTRRMQEIGPLFRETLPEKERVVYDHIYGEGGSPRVVSLGSLANKLNMSPSQLSRIHTSIKNKFRSHQ